MKKILLRSALVSLLGIGLLAGNASATKIAINDSNFDKIEYSDEVVYTFGDWWTTASSALDPSVEFDDPGPVLLQEGFVYDFTFSFEGVTIGTWDEGTGGIADFFYVEAVHDGNVLASSTTQYSGSGTVIGLEFSLDLLETPPNELYVNVWSNVTGADELWTASAANLDGTMAPVPEPSTMLLFGAGLAGLVGYSRKRSNKKA